MPHDFTRVTLVGSRRHLDLLLPSHQPMGTLLPQVLELLGDEPQQEVAAKTLVTADGTTLGASQTLHGAGILDGTTLLLCNSSDTPPAAVVYDVTDLVVEETEDLSGRWSPRLRDAAAASLAVGALWAAAENLLNLFFPASAWWIFLATALALLGAGAAAGRAARSASLGGALLLGGWVFGLSGLYHLRAPTEAAAALVAVLTILTLAAVSLSSRRPRAVIAGALALTLVTALWAGFALILGRPTPTTAAFAAAASVVLLGLLPKLALSTSGLATLDDQRARGGSIRRVDALNAVDAAHRGLSLGTVVVAGSIGAGLWLMRADTTTPEWTLPLLLALTAGTFLRAPSFPLAEERIALYVAAAVGLASLVLGSLRFFNQAPWIVGGVLGLIGVAAAVPLITALPEHAAARFRLLANRAETTAILATVPLLAGMLGVFSELLESFR